MRNLFDQYDQPENKLTHALCCTLDQDRSLIRPFLAWLGIEDIPPAKQLKLVQQQVPGVIQQEAGDDGAGLPDLCIYTEDGWTVLFEMKVQSKLSVSQLRRHISTAKRYGFESPQLITITVEDVAKKLPRGVTGKQWRQIYAWFDRRRSSSIWPKTLLEYMETFEARAVATDYGIRGTITMFNGLKFDSETPYTYPAAKRLIRLLGDELQGRADLKSTLGIDPEGERRAAITNEDWGIWDFLPLRVARGKPFTKYPHLTIGLRNSFATASTTVPHGVAGGFRTKLKGLGSDGFLALIQEIEKQLRLISKRSPSSIPLLYATQRRYLSQRSAPDVDGRIDVDLRTCIKSDKSVVKYQPEWAESVYRLLVNKQSNIQFGIEMRFDYECKVVRSEAAVELFADSWKAMKPLLDFVLE